MSPVDPDGYEYGVRSANGATFEGTWYGVEAQRDGAQRSVDQENFNPMSNRIRAHLVRRVPPDGPWEPVPRERPDEEHIVDFHATEYGCWAFCTCGWIAHVRVGHGIDVCLEAKEKFRRHVVNSGRRRRS